MDLQKLTIIEALKKLESGEFKSVDLIEETFAQIEKNDKKLNSFITLDKENALGKAREIDKKREKGEKVGKLAGIPYSAKDIFVTRGLRTTAGSKILDDYIPQYTASVLKKVDDAGAILIGKTNCDPFGFGSSTENSGYGATHNPWDIERVPGGSSGGSAAAVASGMGLFSIGGDTGGSIRQPANFCSIVGIKPTYGRVSRYGAIAYGSSLDSVGNFAKTAKDSAYVLEAIAGEDPEDSTTLSDKNTNYTKTLDKSIKGLNIGVPKEYFTKDLDPQVKDKILQAVEVLKKQGAKIKDISLPYTKYAVAAYYIFALSEVSSNLGRYDGLRYGVTEVGENYEKSMSKTRELHFEDEVKRRIMLGTYTLSAGYYDAYYKKAMKVRTLLKQDFDNAFKQVDAFIAPVSPTPPFRLGENTADPLQMWLEDAYTVTLNPTGSPGLAIPCGFSTEGLPIGMQIIGPHLSEGLLYNIAHIYQQETEWHKEVPELNFSN